MLVSLLLCLGGDICLAGNKTLHLRAHFELCACVHENCTELIEPSVVYLSMQNTYTGCPWQHITRFVLLVVNSELQKIQNLNFDFFFKKYVTPHFL
jgi:hypothetical protein